MTAGCGWRSVSALEAADPSSGGWVLEAGGGFK